jgi:TRAP-type C4-dicarboxylate transport system permease small subunit
MVRSITGFERVTRWLARANEACLFALVATISTLALMQVILRYGFGRGLFWADELALFAFTWTIFLSAALVLDRRMHFGVYVLIDRLPRRLQQATAIVVHLAMSAVLLFFFGFGLQHAFFNWVQVSDVLRIPMTWWYLSLPAACLLMLLSLFRDLTMLLNGMPLPRHDEEVA